MTMADIRELEEQTKRELDEERAKVNTFSVHCRCCQTVLRI
jgi:hypothetical protein